MSLQIQPPDVQARNAKLLVRVMFLMLPFMYWILTTDLRRAPISGAAATIGKQQVGRLTRVLPQPVAQLSL